MGLFNCLIATYLISTNSNAQPVKPAPTQKAVIKKERHDPPQVLHIKKGAQVTIEQYDAPTNTFLLSIVNEPGVGPNYVTAETLRVAIDFQGDAKAFARQRSQMLGSLYSLTQDLPLIPEETMPLLRKKAATNR